MKLIYVAGPYRASTGWGTEQNIQRARALGGLVVLLDAYPVIPHSNTSHFDGLAADAFWLDGTLELMRRCDAVILTTDWEDSSGARDERAEANRLCKPVFYTIEQLRRWLATESVAEVTP